MRMAHWLKPQSLRCKQDDFFHTVYTTGTTVEEPISVEDEAALGTVLGLGLWQRVLVEDNPHCVLQAFCATLRAARNVAQTSLAYTTDQHTDNNNIIVHVTNFLRYLNTWVVNCWRILSKIVWGLVDVELCHNYDKTINPTILRRQCFERRWFQCSILKTQL